MKSAGKAPDEQARLETLRSFDILDTHEEERFDRLTRIAKRLFDVPVALVSFVDENRQWFKSCVGLDVRESGRDISFCGHAILGDGLFVINDTFEDERFADNPLVIGAPYIRFYAGCPLSAPNGHKLGTLCIVDRQPRTLSPEDLGLLRDLALMAERELAALQMANVDEVTHIFNRRGFRTLAEHSLSVCTQQKLSASLVNIDLDGFKLINDRYGHAEGDLALNAFAGLMRSTATEADVCARLSGDEFVILLLNTPLAAAREFMLRFAEVVDQYNTGASRGYCIEYSHGIVEFSPDAPGSLTDMMAASDRLMYTMKRARKGH